MKEKVISFEQTAKQKERMKKRNAKFRALPIEKQRVKIAQDVIDSLKAGEIVAESRYFSTEDPISHADTKSACDLSHVLDQTTCFVCGIGSLFVSADKNADKIKVKDFLRRGSHRAPEVNYLSTWFHYPTLDKIEEWFECTDFGVLCTKLADMTPRARMIAIMKNIIKNEGEFKPEQFKRIGDGA